MLSSAVQMWPTPCAMNPQDGEGLETWQARREQLKVSAQNGNGCGMPLAIAVQMWPTPAARDYRDDGDCPAAQNRASPQLPAAVGLWATPTVCGNHNRKGASPTSGDGLATQVKSSTTGKSRVRLNPRWVAQLMGLPADWLDGVEHP